MPKNILKSYPDAGHYVVASEDDIAWYRGIYESCRGTPAFFELNWFFFGTSGVHGSYATLDDLTTDDDDERAPWLTVQLVNPRTCRIVYGHCRIDPETDGPWIRDAARRTLLGIVASQTGNYPPGFDPLAASVDRRTP